MSEVDVFTYPKNDRDERIVALKLAIGCVSVDEGIGPSDVIKNAETLLKYMREGTIPSSPALKLAGK